MRPIAVVSVVRLESTQWAVSLSAICAAITANSASIHQFCVPAVMIMAETGICITMPAYLHALMAISPIPSTISASSARWGSSATRANAILAAPPVIRLISP